MRVGELDPSHARRAQMCSVSHSPLSQSNTHTHTDAIHTCVNAGMRSGQGEEQGMMAPQSRPSTAGAADPRFRPVPGSIGYTGHMTKNPNR